MDDIFQYSADCWRTRLRGCLTERGLTQYEFVSELNRQYLTKFHQRDVSRWLNTGNRTSSGIIGFPKYETMKLIADFFSVDVGYLTGETSERTFDMARASEYIKLDADAIATIRNWIGSDSDPHMYGYRAHTLNEMLSSERFPALADKLLTLYEMSTIWRDAPERFDALMSSLASGNDLPDSLAFQLITGAFYGMANESFSSLLRDAYPAPQETVVSEESSFEE